MDGIDSWPALVRGRVALPFSHASRSVRNFDYIFF
jgi:hypothetical protein